VLVFRCKTHAEEGPCGGPAGDEGVNLRAPRGLRDRVREQTERPNYAEFPRVSFGGRIGVAELHGLERRDND
jgi:hypothetical protein